MKEQPVIAEITVNYNPKTKPSSLNAINSSKYAFTVVSQLFYEGNLQLQEEFVVLYLNRTNKVIGGYKLSKCGITGTVADPRLILAIALKTVATGLILAHNLKPSVHHEQLTQKITQCIYVQFLHKLHFLSTHYTFIIIPKKSK